MAVCVWFVGQGVMNPRSIFFLHTVNSHVVAEGLS